MSYKYNPLTGGFSPVPEKPSNIRYLQGVSGGLFNGEDLNWGSKDDLHDTLQVGQGDAGRDAIIELVNHNIQLTSASPYFRFQFDGPNSGLLAKSSSIVIQRTDAPSADDKYNHAISVTDFPRVGIHIGSLIVVSQQDDSATPTYKAGVFHVKEGGANIEIDTCAYIQFGQTMGNNAFITWKLDGDEQQPVIYKGNVTQIGFGPTGGSVVRIESASWSPRSVHIQGGIIVLSSMAPTGNRISHSSNQSQYNRDGIVISDATIVLESGQWEFGGVDLLNCRVKVKNGAQIGSAPQRVHDCTFEYEDTSANLFMTAFGTVATNSLSNVGNDGSISISYGSIYTSSYIRVTDPINIQSPFGALP
jgi:hypothetical protein